MSRRRIRSVPPIGQSLSDASAAPSLIHCRGASFRQSLWWLKSIEQDSVMLRRGSSFWMRSTEGQKIVNYSGHGNVDQWRGNLLTSSDGSLLLNSDRLSLFVGSGFRSGHSPNVGPSRRFDNRVEVDRATPIPFSGLESFTIPASDDLAAGLCSHLACSHLARLDLSWK